MTENQIISRRNATLPKLTLIAMSNQEEYRAKGER